ncbi:MULTISPECIES: hypothetical protein [Bacillus cereus group]|uniref:Uncharacterized protein n=1 Tax=Bacillus cereus TaxID=1396 RepID=A0A9W7QJQ6_BACCE|nr:hypothetical protein [Bacillus cereus]KAB2400100.1 hypothetical protein F8172_01040 [Bacillus cereus]KAB2410472.1 hypothetical protein F8170_02800 [Bacillus cereus]KAB2427734.1 hypothetical protein F8168_21780 [Bacillus cereus]
MLHESNKLNELKITESCVTFENVYSKDYFPKKLEGDIKKANMLILPYERFRDFDNPVFPEETLKFFHFLREKGDPSLITDICISDEEYIELELHADLIVIPMMILSSVVLPVAINVVSDYISSKIESRNRNAELKIKATLTVVHGDSSKIFEYEGDADKFEETFEPVKDLFK